MAACRPWKMYYTAADGLEIPAYLTLPSGRRATKLALIVFPHGGPAARDTAEFDWWAQAMASRSYAVLQPQFRGSALGRQFVVNSRDRGGVHISQRYWDRFMGIENHKDVNLDAISRIKHIEAVNVPVLLIHGRDDTVVPFEQSDVMLAALKKAGKQVELVTLKKEDHWLSRGETRLQMLRSAVAFLEANSPPD